ncbi:hypothetical protein [Pseudoxanthomonas suwonensis]|uniref:hypothetical protein n=1 Tax=Pseudoxanthomonas suwonensis TaxID=314722 RepID=UPI000A5C4ED8|nr:hypothetical protein [Pseudoxanthomonas suwonensis]
MVSLLKRARDGAFQRGVVLGYWWEKQPWPARLYSAGVLVALAAFVCVLDGITYRGVHTTIFVLGALLLAIGLVLEGYWLVDKGLATR